MLRFSLEAIEDDLREEWERLPAEEKHRRNLATAEQAQHEADARETAMTPEQREAARRWFSPH